MLKNYAISEAAGLILTSVTSVFSISFYRRASEQNLKFVYYLLIIGIVLVLFSAILASVKYRKNKNSVVKEIEQNNGKLLKTLWLPPLMLIIAMIIMISTRENISSNVGDSVALLVLGILPFIFSFSLILNISKGWKDRSLNLGTLIMFTLLLVVFIGSIF